jgi:hypothetical protein
MLESGPSDGFASVANRVGNFHPSREKFRVVVMTIADGAMSSETLYEFWCSKKCSESGGVS